MRGRTLVATVFTLCGLGAATACGGSPGSAGAAAPADTADPAARSGSSTGSVAAAPEGESLTAGAPSGARRADKPLKGKVVVIDPGHNGANGRHPEIVNKKVFVHTKWKPCDTTGTSTDDGYSEAAFTWDVANRTARALRAAGATVKLTRGGNTGVGPCITERAAAGNRAKADAAISIHADGAGASAHGFHVIMPKKINGPVDPVVDDSRRLGIDVRDAFRAGTRLPYSNYIGRDALDFRTDLGGLNLSTVPKVFIECGNMRNAAEAAKFKNPQVRQRMGDSLAQGIQNYLT